MKNFLKYPLWPLFLLMTFLNVNAAEDTRSGPREASSSISVASHSNLLQNRPLSNPSPVTAQATSVQTLSSPAQTSLAGGSVRNEISSRSILSSSASNTGQGSSQNLSQINVIKTMKEGTGLNHSLARPSISNPSFQNERGDLLDKRPDVLSKESSSLAPHVPSGKFPDQPYRQMLETKFETPLLEADESVEDTGLPAQIPGSTTGNHPSESNPEHLLPQNVAKNGNQRGIRPDFGSQARDGGHSTGGFSRTGGRLLAGWEETSGGSAPRRGPVHQSQGGGSFTETEWTDSDGDEHRFTEHRDGNGRTRGFVHNFGGPDEHGGEVELTTRYDGRGNIEEVRRTDRSSDGGIVVRVSHDEGRTFEEVFVQKGTDREGGGEKDEESSSTLSESENASSGGESDSSHKKSGENETSSEESSKDEGSDQSSKDDDKNDSENDDNKESDESDDKKDEEKDDEKTSPSGPDIGPIDGEDDHQEEELIKRFAPWHQTGEESQEDENERVFNRREEGQPGAEGREGGAHGTFRNPRDLTSQPGRGGESIPQQGGASQFDLNPVINPDE